MGKSIFGLRGNDGRFALGSVSKKINKSFRTAYVLAHTAPRNKPEEHYKEVLVDAFRIKEDKEFCRQFDLPENTKYVELLGFDGVKAVPIKLFHLVDESEFDFDRCSYTTVQINTNKSNEKLVRLRVFEAPNSGEISPEFNHNIGWAMEYPYLDVPQLDCSHITQIQVADLKIPKVGKAIKVIPNEHRNHEKKHDINIPKDTPSIRKRILKTPRKYVSFIFPAISTPKDFEGMSVFILNRHLLAAREWVKGKTNNHGAIENAIEKVFITGFAKRWRVAAKIMEQRYKSVGDIGGEEINSQLNLFEHCLCKEFRYIDLMEACDPEAGDPSFDLKREDQGYVLEISFICPGDHIIFLDQYDREILIEWFIPADNDRNNKGIASLEVCANGFKQSSVDYQSNEDPYMRNILQNAEALPDNDGLLTKRSKFSRQFKKFMQHRKLAGIDHDLAPLLYFQFHPQKSLSGVPLLNNEIVSHDIQAIMMAITLGGSVSQNRKQRQQPDLPLLNRSLAIRGFPDLLANQADYREEMRIVDRLLHAKKEDIQTCGECLHDLKESELDFKNLADQVREYRKYFVDEPLGPFVAGDTQHNLVKPGKQKLSASELSEQLTRLRDFKQLVTPLLIDGNNERFSSEKKDSSGLRSDELYNKLEQAFSILQRMTDKQSDTKLTDLCFLKEKAKGNAPLLNKIWEAIGNYSPELLDRDVKIIKKLQRSLTEWASMPERYGAMRGENINIISKSENDLTEKAKETAECFDRNVEKLKQNSFVSKKIYDQLSSQAANLTMSIQHREVSNIIDKCCTSDVTVPIKLRRQFAIWPRKCESTWCVASTLVNDLPDDIREQIGFEDFDVKKAVLEAQNEEQTL